MQMPPRSAATTLPAEETVLLPAPRALPHLVPASGPDQAGVRRHHVREHIRVSCGHRTVELDPRLTHLSYIMICKTIGSITSQRERLKFEQLPGPYPGSPDRLQPHGWFVPGSPVQQEHFSFTHVFSANPSQLFPPE